MHEHSSDRVTCTPRQHFLDHALELARLGIRVHPLKPGTKEPHQEGYQRLATTDEAQVRRDWLKWSDAHIGFIAGEGSGTFVLDVDHRNKGDVALRTLEAQHPALPVTWQYSTSDGPRIMFRYPATGRVHTGDIMPGITVLGEGRNVVGPGSIHKSGARYEWDEFMNPSTIPLAEAPIWLLDMMREKGLYREASDEPVAQGKASMGTPPRDPNVILAYSALDPAAKCLSGSLDGAKVKALFGQWDVVQRCLQVLGLGDVKPLVKFRCIVHPDEHPSAAVLPPRSSDEHFIYADFHHHKDEPYLIPLPLLYYCKVTGASTATRLPAPSFQVWALRLLAAAGVIAGVPMQAPKLKGHVPQDARRVYAGFVELLSLKWLHTRGAPSPLSWRFAEAWLGMPQTSVAKAIGWLLGRGYLRAVAQEGKLYHFLFGTRALINRRSKRRHAPEAAHQTAIVADVAQDHTAMLTPDAHACPECGESGYITSRGCEWCTALELKRRLDEKKALYRPPAFASG